MLTKKCQEMLLQDVLELSVPMTFTSCLLMPLIVYFAQYKRVLFKRNGQGSFTGKRQNMLIKIM